MHSSFHAVVHFQVQLGQLVFLVGTGLLNVSQRRGIDNIADNEALDRLVLGDSLSSRDASDTLDVAAALLITTVIAAFDSHTVKETKRLRVRNA